MNEDWFNDSIACLNVSKNTIKYLEKLTQQAINDETQVPYLKVHTKNTLENLKSPLDYSANYIFDTYCRSEYVSNNEIRKNRANKPQFPLTDTKPKFQKEMDGKFKNLEQNQPEIYDLLKSMQYFNNRKWIKLLNKLVNDNKHNFLTKHALKEYGIQAKSLKLINGNTLTNIGAFDNGGHNIVIDGIPFNEHTDPTHPYVVDYEADFFYKFYFANTDNEVVETLHKIYEEIEKYIHQLHNLSKKNS